jgi:hypothetical protein
MSNKPIHDNRDNGQRLLGVLALAIACIGLAKFLGLMVLYGPAQSPWMFLLVFVLTFLTGRRLLPSHPRIGAAIIGAFAAWLVVICAAALVVGMEPADYVLVFVGGPLAVGAVGLAARAFGHAPSSRSSTDAPE